MSDNARCNIFMGPFWVVFGSVFDWEFGWLFD